jgi:hypothetical protein
MNHLASEEIAAIVTGGDAPSLASRRHLATCTECAGRLEREARLEMEIYEAASALGTGAVPSVASPGWRITMSAAAVLFLAVVGWIGWPRERPDRSTSPTTIASTLAEPPCLRDPRSFAPGYDVQAPEPPGLRVTPPAARP